MDKSTLARALRELNSNLPEPPADLEDLLQRRCEEISSILNCSRADLSKSTLTGLMTCNKDTHEWRYICLNFHILESLNTELSKSDTNVLSVQDIKDVKSALRTLMLHGIFKNLQPKLPLRVACNDQTDILYAYDALKCTAFGLYNCTKRSDLRMLVLPHCLQGILSAVLQIGYCPLKKPPTGFMTEELYENFSQDQKVFRDVLDDMSRAIHPAIFVKELMVLFQAGAPLWFKRTVSSTLTKMLRSRKGVQSIASAMLDGRDDDVAQTWKVLDVLTKVIVRCPDFEANIGPQVLDLLGGGSLIFERLVVSCTKCLSGSCLTVFLERITRPLTKLMAHEECYKFGDGDDVTDEVQQTVRLLHGCFADNSARLPLKLLRRFLSVMFHLHHLTVKSALRVTGEELKEILMRYLRECAPGEVDRLLDAFLFGFTVEDVPRFRNDVIVEVDERILVRTSPHCVISAADVMDTVYNLLDVGQKVILFGYLLRCIGDKERYLLTPVNSKELFGAEDHAAGPVIERLLTIHKLLAQLSENEDVQKSLTTKPDDVIEYVSSVLAGDITDSQLVFVVVMILDNLLSNAPVQVIWKYEVLTPAVAAIATEAKEEELRKLCSKVLARLRETNVRESAERGATEFEKALEDVYDPLVPTRGHGLLVLAKLVEKKDEGAMERKQYLLNLFQLYLKDEDSFIYLNAIRGLVALADVFPDTILDLLCEEYSDFTKRGDAAQETRMKLGEVLVRIVKLLGDTAPKYKSLLLNTFLSGTKDEDHLLRASSLSNLGEVCRILNYKLGTIVTEVLACVHAIISTDKAVEARRAAVAVIRQLFVGLQGEMVAFLKEEILPVYRTLKEIYRNDGDDVMRLQAQLALEELNENMKSFVFPNAQVQLEKKMVMLD